MSGERGEREREGGERKEVLAEREKGGEEEREAVVTRRGVRLAPLAGV